MVTTTKTKQKSKQKQKQDLGAIISKYIDTAQPPRVRSEKQQGSWDTARIMGTEDNGHSKNHRQNDKEDAQPPRLRQKNQDSPPGCNFYVLLFMFSPTTLNVVRKKAGTGGSEL